MSLRILSTVVLVFGVLNSSLPAGDWPQILGPNRDGIAIQETLLEEWPVNGPQQVWSEPVGEGFAGVAVRGDALVLFHRLDDAEVVDVRDAATGKQRWKSEAACDYQSGLSSDNGPRCVPLIAGNRIYVYGVQGMLRCLDLQTGDEFWSRDTWKDFSAPEGYFGAGSSPVLVDDRLIVNVGGRDNAAVVAFDTKNGNTVWQSFNDTASYSSPIVTTANSVRHAIVVTRLHVVSLNPDDGAVRFQFPFGMRGPTVNGATPVLVDDQLFVSSSYRVGSVLAKISEASVDPAASGEDLLATQYATPIVHDNKVFAVDGRQDIGQATLKCLTPKTRKIHWEKPGFDYGTLVKVGGELLFLTNGGELIRFDANPDRYVEKQRVRVLEPTARGYRLPAVSNGRLFVRDDSELKCLQIGVSR